MTPIPPPQASPQPPSLADEDSSVRQLTVHDARLLLEQNKGPSTFKVVMIAALTAVGGTGGAIAFLLGFAGESRAQAVEAARGIVAVQSLRIDQVAADNTVLKQRVEAVDAGVAEKIRQLEAKVDAAAERSDKRGEEQEKLLRQILVEARKR